VFRKLSDAVKKLQKLALVITELLVADAMLAPSLYLCNFNQLLQQFPVFSLVATSY